MQNDLLQPVRGNVPQFEVVPREQRKDGGSKRRLRTVHETSQNHRDERFLVDVRIPQAGDMLIFSHFAM